MGFSIYITTKGGDDDDVDGRDTESPDGEGADDGDPDGVAVELGPLTQTEGGRLCPYWRHHVALDYLFRA